MIVFQRFLALGQFKGVKMHTLHAKIYLRNQFIHSALGRMGFYDFYATKSLYPL